MLEIIQVPVLPANANYNYILHGNGQTVVIDPSVAEDIIEILDQRGWKLDYIYNTHHHWDHTGGNLKLQQHYGAIIVGFAQDKHRIPGINKTVLNNEEINICGQNVKVMHLPGHTLGHIAYYFIEEKALFSGDVIFSAGCGRLFEGTATEAYSSLQRINSLPKDTKIYCAHEYTLDNCIFALTVEPQNIALYQYMEKVRILRANNLPSIPTTIAIEQQINPFLRVKNISEFALVRSKKDSF